MVTLYVQRDKADHIHTDTHADVWIKIHTYRSIKHTHACALIHGYFNICRGIPVAKISFLTLVNYSLLMHQHSQEVIVESQEIDLHPWLPSITRWLWQASLSEGDAGHSLLWSRRAQQVSLGIAMYRVTISLTSVSEFSLWPRLGWVIPGALHHLSMSRTFQVIKFWYHLVQATLQVVAVSGCQEWLIAATFLRQEGVFPHMIGVSRAL